MLSVGGHYKQKILSMQFVRTNLVVSESAFETCVVPSIFSTLAVPFISPLENERKTHDSAMTGGLEGCSLRSLRPLDRQSLPCHVFFSHFLKEI